jgi:TPP-dependent pyruvate/acetoin dehydrogenase alpha subunit
MAAKYPKGDDVVVAGYMGDGATSANDFHAGMNFARSTRRRS